MSNPNPTDNYTRFRDWAKNTDTRVLSEQEYNDRVGKYRIRTSPIEQEIRELEGQMARLYREFQTTVAELRHRVRQYQETIEHDLKR